MVSRKVVGSFKQLKQEFNKSSQFAIASHPHIAPVHFGNFDENKEATLEWWSDWSPMSAEDFLKTYNDTHQNPINRALHNVGIPMIMFSIVLFLIDFFWLQKIFLGLALWHWAVILFIFGWVLQFIGHAFEGKPPAFFSNPLHLLSGAAWWFKKIFGKK